MAKVSGFNRLEEILEVFVPLATRSNLKLKNILIQT